MNWQEALEEIQSVEFDVNLNVVSGTNAFFQAVAQEPAVLEACRELRQSGEVREDALGRIHQLVKQETDPRFETSMTCAPATPMIRHWRSCYG